MKKLVVALLILLVVPGTASSQSKKKAPDFSLKTPDGKNFTLSEMKGKVVLINFWATWCGPCRAEIPGFLEIYEKYRSKGLEIVGISLDERGWQVVQPFVQRLRITYPIVIGSENLVNSYGGFDVIPTSFLIDRQGNIVEEHIGYLSKEKFEKVIKQLL